MEGTSLNKVLFTFIIQSSPDIPRQYLVLLVLLKLISTKDVVHFLLPLPFAISLNCVHLTAATKCPK